MDELNKQNLEALFYKLGLDKKGSFDDFFNGMSVKENREAFFYKSGLDKKGSFDQFEQGIVISRPQEVQEDELDLGILNNTWVGNLIKNGKKAIQRGYEQGEAVNPSIELLYDANDASSEDIQDFVKQVNDQGRYQPSEEYKEWSNTDGWLNSAALLATKGHKILPEIILESASAFVRSAVTNPGAAGAGIGALSGVGAVYTVPALAFSVSSALETSGKFQESMQEELNKRGLKFDEDGIREVLSDPEAMSEIRSKAIIRGGVVGAIDALTAGLTGKIVGKALLKGSGKGVAALKGLGVESTGGAAGDALGSLAIGEEIKPASVLGEFFGEIGSPGAYINIYQGFKQDASTLQNTGKQGKVDAANQTVSSTRVSDPLSDKTIQNAAESVLMGDKTLFDEVLDQNVEVKAITSEESQQLKELYDELDEINATIPEEVNDINSRSQIITNIKKRKLIEDLLKAEEGKDVDVAFEESKKIKTNNLKNQIDELNIKIKKLAEPPSQKTTPKAAEKQDVSEKQPSEISTKVTTKESKITPDAEAFLNNLDQDGVPLIITNKLKKIGLNNGFSEKEIDAMTPNALIQGLKDKKEGKSKQPKNLTDDDFVIGIKSKLDKSIGAEKIGKVSLFDDNGNIVEREVSPKVVQQSYKRDFNELVSIFNCLKKL